MITFLLGTDTDTAGDILGDPELFDGAAERIIFNPQTLDCWWHRFADSTWFLLTDSGNNMIPYSIIEMNAREVTGGKQELTRH